MIWSPLPGCSLSAALRHTVSQRVLPASTAAAAGLPESQGRLRRVDHRSLAAPIAIVETAIEVREDAGVA
jgi:hypothetical protein